MKLMIDIPYGHYCTIKDGFLSECLQATTEAILNGTLIPDNATNGDMIKALFNIKEVEMSNTYCVHFPEEEDFGHYFFKDWWNSPYNRGETDE